MTCSVNHSTITTKFCSVCGAPATTAQAPAQPPQWNQPPAAAPQWNQPPAQPYMPPAQPYAPQPTYAAPTYNAPAVPLAGYAYPLASTGKRIGSSLLTGVFSGFTCYLSYIWHLIVLKDGQSPGKQVLNMRVYSTQTSRPATWGNMFIRDFLIPFSAFLLFIPAYIALFSYEDSYSYYYGDYTGTNYAPLFFVLAFIVIIAYVITDLIMFFNSPTKQSLKDKLAKTVVLDESYR